MQHELRCQGNKVRILFFCLYFIPRSCHLITAPHPSFHAALGSSPASTPYSPPNPSTRHCSLLQSFHTASGVDKKRGATGESRMVGNGDGPGGNVSNLSYCGIYLSAPKMSYYIFILITNYHSFIHTRPGCVGVSFIILRRCRRYQER